MITGAIAVLAFAVLYWNVVPAQWRGAALLLFGALLFQAVASSLAINLGLVLAALLILRQGRMGGSQAAIVIALGLLLLNKYGDVPTFQVVGLSYVSFRLISLSREISKRKSAPPSLRDGILYALFPPTFLSGPIEPYERFQKNTIAATLSRTELFASLWRLALGLAKKLLIVEPLGAFATDTFGPTLPTSMLWPGLFAYSLFVYIDFSAYSDLAIGAARLFGYSIGENFNWPYLSASISEFWTRWHISLSQFLRDHVFLPLSGRFLKVPSFAKSPVLVASFASLITMLLCGMWHGNRASFAVWGLGHGVFICLHQLHRQQIMGRLPARRRMKVQAHPIYRGAATVLTFLCVSLLWVPFRFSLAESVIVYGRLGSVLFQTAM